jgi:hypothetical protein
MPSITDITFNNTIFSQVNHWVVILHQPDERPSVIALPNAHLFTFIQPFDDMPWCQNYISSMNTKIFSLFAYSENIRTWLWNHNVIPDHLEEIIIYCPSPNDKKYLKAWSKRFTHKIKDIIECNELDRESLIFGMKYIKNLYPFFKDDVGILNLLKEEYRRIGVALIASLANEVSNDDDDIRPGAQPH